MLTVSAHPETLDQVESSVQNWLGDSSKIEGVPFAFIRIPNFSNRLRLSISNPSPDVKFEMEEQRVLLQVKNKQLNLNLDRFQLTPAFKDMQLSLNIDGEPELENRYLLSALRDFADTKHPVFFSRVLRAVKRLEEDLSTALINEAAAAPTDLMVILEALSSASLAAQLASEDPLLAARLRGMKRKQEMLEASGGALTSEQVSEILGISRQAVDKRRASNQLLALTQGRRGYSYPSFQFDDGKTVEGPEELLGELSALDPWMQLAFFTTVNERLGGSTPLAKLQKGHKDEVKAVAGGFGEQGAP